MRGVHLRKMLAATAAAAVGCLAVTASLPRDARALVTDPAGDYDNFAKALQYSLYFYDGNMCGPQVDENSGFAWRADCHTYDAAVPLQPMDADSVGTNLSAEFIEQNYDILNTGTEEGTCDVSGGFHDAGDHVKFGLPEAYAGTTLSWGYYEFPDAYEETGQTEHIETILRYFCDYFMRCTFRDANGNVVAFCYQVGDGDIDHAYWQLPQNDTMARPAWFATPDNPTTCNVTNTAACLAINYLNFKDSDPEYAEQCLDYAKALFAFADTNDKAIADTEQGPKGYYGSSKWEDDYCFAACWLYLITQDKAYLDKALPLVDYYAAPSYVYCWNDMWNGVDILLGVISDTYKSDTTFTEDENPNGLSDLAVEFLKIQNKTKYEKVEFWAGAASAIHAYMDGKVGQITPQGYFWLNTWGSCRYNTAAQFCALVYDKYHADTEIYDAYTYLENGTDSERFLFSDWAKGQMEYILGNNDITYLEKDDGSHGPRSFLVGFDENSAAYPHHRAASGLTKCEDTDQQLYVLFGALCGGPDSSDAHKDLTADYIYNEVTIDYNAACPGAAAGLYLRYQDDYEQAVTPDFPPEDDGGRGSSSGGDDSGGSKGTWVEACGIDDLNADGAGVTKVSLMVKSTESKPPQNMTVRYYIDTSEIADFSKVEASILYDQVSAEAPPNACVISAPQKWEKDPKYAYVELSWGDYNFVNCGKKLQFKVGFYYGDTWDPTNDPSYRDLAMFEEDDAFFGTGNEVRTDYICVYEDGTLIGGIEPDGTTVDTTPPATETTTSGSGSTTTTTTTTITTTTTTSAADSTTTTTTTTTLTDTTTTAPAGTLLGDVDENGVVNVEDAVLLARILCDDAPASLTQQGMRNADCRSGGGVNSEDLSLLLGVLSETASFD